MMIPTRIKGIGKYTPDNVITNEDLSKILDTSDEWIYSRTGIKERRVVSGNESVADLAFKASINAIEKAGIDKDAIDAIIVATSIPDHLYPSVACEVHYKLGLKRNIPAFDVTAACTGFIYAMNIARSFIRSGEYENVLVVGADINSRFVDWDDRSTCVLFGDGAGAFVVSKSDDGEEHILAIKVCANGEKSQELRIPLVGENCPLVEPNEQKEQKLVMNGREIYKFAVSTVPASILETLEIAGLSIEDVDYLVPHQANIRIVDAICERLSLRKDQVYANMDKYGNTSAASIPIAVAEAVENGFLKTPSTIVVSGFGAGLTWGSAVIKLENMGKQNG